MKEPKDSLNMKYSHYWLSGSSQFHGSTASNNENLKNSLNVTL